MPHPEWWASRKTGYAFKMPVVGLGIFAVLLKALRNDQGVNKEHLWVCLSGCFQRGFIKEGRHRVNAGSDILWAGVHPWLNDKDPEWSQMSTSFPTADSVQSLASCSWLFPALVTPILLAQITSPSKPFLLEVAPCQIFLVTVMGKITVLKWASSKVTGFSTAQITDQKSHLSWVNTQKATAAIRGDDVEGEQKLHWIEKSTTELFRERSWHTEVGHMK